MHCSHWTVNTLINKQTQTGEVTHNNWRIKATRSSETHCISNCSFKSSTSPFLRHVNSVFLPHPHLWSLSRRPAFFLPLLSSSPYCLPFFFSLFYPLSRLKSRAGGMQVWSWLLGWHIDDPLLRFASCSSGCRNVGLVSLYFTASKCTTQTHKQTACINKQLWSDKYQWRNNDHLTVNLWEGLKIWTENSF